MIKKNEEKKDKKKFSLQFTLDYSNVQIQYKMPIAEHFDLV